MTIFFDGGGELFYLRYRAGLPIFPGPKKFANPPLFMYVCMYVCGYACIMYVPEVSICILHVVYICVYCMYYNINGTIHPGEINVEN